MPIIKNKYQNVKIWRPDGMKYAHGQAPIPFLSVKIRARLLPIAAEMAVTEAVKAFGEEFGYFPDPDVAIELLYTGDSVRATLFDLNSVDDGT